MLPHNAAGLDGGTHEIAAQVSVAWESADLARIARMRPDSNPYASGIKFNYMADVM
ncbi:hypothetical protein [Bradyrhizobium sp. JR3.5]